MTHTLPQTPEWSKQKEAMLTEFYVWMDQHGYRTDTAGSKKSVEYWLSVIDLLLSDHDRELVEGLEKMRQRNVDNNISGKVVNKIESYEEALSDAQEFIKKGI